MNATTDSPDTNAADLQRRGEQIRANLDQTLDEIQHRFSSGELLDRSVEFIRQTGSEFLREAGETVRRNPVPTVLTAAGLIWLATSVAKSRSGDRYGYESREEQRSRLRAREEEDYPDLGYARAEGVWDSSAHNRVSNAAHEVRSRARQVKGQVTRRTRQARSQFEDLVQEQPLALGALALAVGALIGAALPITEYENKWVGPVHDRTVARAKEVGRREYDNLRQAVASSLERRSDGSGGSSSDNASQRPVQG